MVFLTRAGCESYVRMLRTCSERWCCVVLVAARCLRSNHIPALPPDRSTSNELEQSAPQGCTRHLRPHSHCHRGCASCDILSVQCTMSSPANKRRKTQSAVAASPPLPTSPTAPPAPTHSALSAGSPPTTASSSPSSALPDVESLFLSHAAREAGGITYNQFLAAHPGLSVSLLLPAINNLLSRGRLLLLSDASTAPPTHYYKHIEAEAASRMLGLSATDLVLYQLIAREGNRGLWVRDIRRRSGVGAVEVGKVLKLLMARKLVKCEKSIEGNNKKVYMLYELEPAKEVRGNSWYGNGEFDKDFIDALRQTSMQFIRQRAQQSAPLSAVPAVVEVVGAADGAGAVSAAAVTAEEVSDFLKSTGVFEVECTLEEMGMVLDGLVFDGLLTSTRAEKGELGGRKAKVRYSLQRGGRYETPLVQIPCVLCPIRSQCSEELGSVVSPYTCEYYTKWLEF